jgi:hypothetical protein
VSSAFQVKIAHTASQAVLAGDELHIVLEASAIHRAPRRTASTTERPKWLDVWCVDAKCELSKCELMLHPSP